MKPYLWCGIIVMTVWLGATPTWAAEAETLKEAQFQERMRGLAAEREDAERLSRAVDLTTRHSLSSAQVKAVAARLGDDAARLEFARAAFPRTVDPENFYEVYDAFTRFSQVMRLHDWVRERARPGSAIVMAGPRRVSEEEMRSILQALRSESFDKTRDKVGRQILTSSHKKFLSTQIRAMLKCFDFETTRLEFAKFAYDYALDPELYFQVNEAFDFTSSRDSLARYIQTRNEASPPPRR